MLRKILIVVLILVIVLGVGYGYFLLYQEKENAVKMSKEVEMNLSIVQKENEKLKGELNETVQQFDAQKEENQKITEAINDLKESSKDTAFELDMMTKERDVLLKRMEGQSQKINELKDRISALKEEIAYPKEAAIVPPQSEEVKLEDIKVEEANQGIETANSQSEEVKPENKVQEEKQKAAGLEVTAVSRFSAQIMAFNKEYKFIVINRGEKDGIKLDANYDLVVQGNKAGRLKPDRVYESMSVFDILEGAENINDGIDVELVAEE